MKSTLLLAGLLAVSGGLAHAQGLTIAGNGRMGLQYDNNGLAGGSDWRAENRLQLNFTAAAEGDNGLRFGAFSRAQMDVGRAGLFSGSRVWVETSGLRLTFGNQDGAIATSGTARGVDGRIGYEGGQQHGETGGLRGVTPVSAGRPVPARIPAANQLRICAMPVMGGRPRSRPSAGAVSNWAFVPRLVP